MLYEFLKGKIILALYNRHQYELFTNIISNTKIQNTLPPYNQIIDGLNQFYISYEDCNLKCATDYDYALSLKYVPFDNFYRDYYGLNKEGINGKVVTLRRGDSFLVIGDRLIGLEQYANLSKYKDDLTYIDNKEFDIVYVQDFPKYSANLKALERMKKRNGFTINDKLVKGAKVRAYIGDKFINAYYVERIIDKQVVAFDEDLVFTIKVDRIEVI